MKKYKILVVDDNKDFVDAFNYMLKDVLGNDIDVLDAVYNGKQCLEILVEKRYDFVFMDINMPEMDGIQTTKMATYLYRDLYVVALSFHKEFEYVQQMIEAGARRYIKKEEITKDTLEKVFNN